jgi:hypothetical protein
VLYCIVFISAPLIILHDIGQVTCYIHNSKVTVYTIVYNRLKLLTCNINLQNKQIIVYTDTGWGGASHSISILKEDKMKAVS